MSTTISLLVPSIALVGSTSALFVRSLLDWALWPRPVRLPVVPGHRGMRRPVHPLALGDVRFGEAW